MTKFEEFLNNKYIPENIRPIYSHNISRYISDLQHKIVKKIECAETFDFQIPRYFFHNNEKVDECKFNDPESIHYHSFDNKENDKFILYDFAKYHCHNLAEFILQINPDAKDKIYQNSKSYKTYTLCEEVCNYLQQHYKRPNKSRVLPTIEEEEKSFSTTSQ